MINQDAAQGESQRAQPHIDVEDCRRLLAPFLEAARAGQQVRAAVNAIRRSSMNGPMIEGAEVELGLLAATQRLCWADFKNLLDTWSENV